MKPMRQISDKDLLKMFGISSFHHMTKDKLANFVSALPAIDPEVAKKALEQFLDLSTAMVEIVSHYRGVVSECLAESDGDTRLCLETCASIVASIQQELSKGNLAAEQQKSLIDQSMELVRMMREIEADGKQFRKHVIYAASITAGFIVCALASVLGGKTDFVCPDPCRTPSRT